MNDMGTVINSHTVQYERLLPASIETVWSYISNPAENMEWRQCVRDYTIEPTLGGRVSFRICSPPGLPEVPVPMPSQGVIQFQKGLVFEYEPPRLLAYSFFDPPVDLASYVRFELEEADGQTLLRFTHSHLPADMMAQVAAGWHINLDTLAALLAGEQPPNFLKGFGEWYPKYASVIAAGIIIASTAAPVAAASDNNAYQIMRDQRQQYLRSYDKIWKEADQIKGEIDTLKHSSADTGRALDDLDRDLRDKYRQLRQIELDVRDLEKATAASPH